MSKTETCLKVVEVLGAQMGSTPLSRIKVTDICRDAGISRATFYEYFDDVYAVATWMWDYLMKSTLYRSGVDLNAYQAHLMKFQVIQEHRDFFNAAMREVGYSSIVQHGGRTMYDHISDVCVAKIGHDLSLDQRLEIEFFVTGAKHMTRHWAEERMEVSPYVMAKLFTDALPPFARVLLEPESRVE